MRISRKAYRLLKQFIFFIFFVLASILIYYFFKHKSLYVVNISVTPPPYVSDISYITNNELAKKTAYVFPSQHIAFIPKKRIRREIMGAYPEIKMVNIDRESLNTISIAADLRLPLFTLDDGLTLDSEGTSYIEPKDTSDLPYINYGSTTLPVENIQKIADFYKKINVRLSKTSRVIIDSENDVTFHIKGSSKVIAKLEDDYSILWSNLLSALDTDPLKSLLQKSSSKLEYIDLRFGNKVFYKFASQPITSATTTNDTRILEEIDSE